MAPIRLQPELEDDDDFIRTISDNDGPLSPDREPDSDLSDSHPQKPPLTKKRKLKELQKDGETNQASHKRQKSNSKPKDSISKQQGPEEEEDLDWTAGGEDDGAMNSDFEFEVQGLGNGVISTFNGWDVEDSDRSQQQRKGVDIDALIAKRRAKIKISNGDRDPSQDAEMIVEAADGVDAAITSAEDSEIESQELADAFMFEDEVEDENLADDAFGMGAAADEDDPEEAGLDAEEDQLELEPDSESDDVADEMPEPSDDGSEDEQERENEKAQRDAFFAPETPSDKTGSAAMKDNSFQTFSLSRPILRGLTSAGFTKPTPIQSRTIPTALMGKDVVGGAVTGSGKTAAFIIPIIERLLYRPKRLPTSRVAIFTPTRELATQCFEVARKLASYTDITFCQLVGGMSLREQENILKKRPDVIIATPGRFIDHMRNSPSFTIDTLEILVLDEADRMLEEGFADELNEILTTIPQSRQTMLFSATMTDKVDKLIRVGLQKPVRIMVDARKQTVGTLTQEFVRLRPGKEDLRLGYLAYLCSEVFTDRVIVFFRQKKEVHRVRVIFGLLGIKATELHGSMTQEQRISAITSFTAHTSTHLLATDLASRGLDIPSVSTVLNYSAPQTHEIYLHRVGRTARAGRVGRSCTLASEEDRKVVKSVVRTAKAQGAKIVSRIIPPSEGEKWRDRIESLEGEVEEVLREEKEEKEVRAQETMVKKGENLLEFEDEIRTREKRTWFISEKEKERGRKKGALELNGEGKGKKTGRGKLSGKEKKRRDDRRERGEGRMWKKGKGGGEGSKGVAKGKVGKGAAGGKHETGRKEKMSGRGGKDRR